MMQNALFEGFDPAEIARASRQIVADKAETRRAVAQKSANRHHMRRANAESTLADILPAKIEPGESWHVISRGDIDSLSYVRHILAGVDHLDHVLMSTWCIAKNALTEITAWLDAGRIEQFDLYGCRLIVAKNHSKVTLCSVDDYQVVIESSANVNTNPRIEQSALHNNPELHAFYLEFFAGVKSIDKQSKIH